MTRLHIGCGPEILPGWVNLDHQAHPGVDQVLDVRDGLPYAEVDFIFAEHFLEHLTLAEALAFLAECRRALQPNGVLRLSTPNLDWVWVSHYREPAQLSAETAELACLEINRAFHGWGHRFLWNRSTLAAALAQAGFADLAWCAYGESRHPDLAGVERHLFRPDQFGHPQILIVEASGRGPGNAFAERSAPYLADLAAR